MEIVKLILSPIVTFLVGSFAIGLYCKQKIENRRNAAQLILQEIRYAEQQIRNYRISSNYPLADKLLPTNNWNRNIHLFVKTLSETELDLISRFYANSAYLDEVIGKISDDANNAKIFKQPIIPMPIIQQSQPQMPVATQPPISITIQEVELDAQNILRDVSNQVELIYNTPAIDKLRCIASSKVWFIF